MLNELGTTDIEKYFEELESQEVINDRESDVQGPETDSEGNKIYQVETTGGQTVEIIVDNGGNITVGEITKSTAIKISKVTINSTASSITVEALARNMEVTDDLVISYRLEGSTAEFTEVKREKSESVTAQITGLTVGNRYEVEVKIVDKDGNIKVKKNDITQTGIAVTELSLNNTETILHTRGTCELTASVSPPDSSIKDVTWSSSDESVATVDENGVVTAKESGETTITATALGGIGVTKTCHVMVDYYLSGATITLNGSSFLASKGANITTQLKYGSKLIPMTHLVFSLILNDTTIETNNTGTFTLEPGCKSGSYTVQVSSKFRPDNRRSTNFVVAPY